MAAVGLGLIAAFAWGLHDLCVRYVSQRTPILSALLTVLITGAFFQAIVIIIQLDFTLLPLKETGLAVIAGVCFAIANIGLYKAFEIGPVGLVAPLTATYSILSVLWGAVTGQPVSFIQWCVVLLVPIGIAIVAAFAKSDQNSGLKAKISAAIGWALLASVCFALTFGLGQSLMTVVPDLMGMFTIRLAAIVALILIIVALKAPLWAPRPQWRILGTMGFLDAFALACVLTAGNLVNANFAAVAASAFGVITIILAWAFLKERMTTFQWVGVGITFSAIAYLAQ